MSASDSDELDLLSASSVTLVDITPISTEKRVLRPRLNQSLGTPSLPEGRKRPRTLSNPVSLGHVVKKRRTGDTETTTVMVNHKKAALEAARKRWLHRHRHLFVPLLPSTSVLFHNVQKDLDHSIPYIPLHQLEEQPKLIQGGFMKEYQLQGLSYLAWMYHNGMNCILGDEMGLGKTLQTLALFAYIRESTTTTHDPHLIICPLSVLSSWQSEAARWLPSFRTLRFHGSASERNRIKDSIRRTPFDLCITTYEAYGLEDTWFKSRRWTYCVLDEGHKIKNSETNIAHAVQGIGSLFRLILTGTPVQNNLVELWGLLHWLYPTVFTPVSEQLFKNSFNLSKGQYNLAFLNSARALLSTVMLRRTKAVIDADVPPREELTVFIPMSEAQRFWTYRLLTRMDTLSLNQIFNETGSKMKTEGENDMEGGRQEVLQHLEMMNSGTREGNQWKKLMNLLLQLRKVCDHPYLLPNAEPSPYMLGEHIVAASAKMIVIDKLLADILPKGERVLIFSQWTSMLDLLEDFMSLRSIPYARLDGSTTRPRRTLDIKLFQQEVSPYKVFLISTKAGGLGINLTRASTVIMCDSDWNPQNDMQAIARAHRIGQTKTVYRLICRGSVEDQMLDRIRRKLFLSVKVMSSEGHSTNSNSLLGLSELMDILKKGSSALSQPEYGMNLQRFLKAEIGEILQFSKEQESGRDIQIKNEMLEDDPSVTLGGKKDEEQLLRKAEEEELALLSGVAQVQSRLFEGRMVRREIQDNQQIANEWRALQKRAKINRTVEVDGIVFLVEEAGLESVIPKVVEKPPKKAKFESEDWCVYCRDGGELILCGYCPRVFHADCHGLPKQGKIRLGIKCSQHSCAVCERNTSQAGSMLFRCQTCPQAFCEDCMPNGDIDAVGETLPEFELLGYAAKSGAFYIRCTDCHTRFEKEPNLWKAWQEEMRETQKKLDALGCQ